MKQHLVPVFLILILIPTCFSGCSKSDGVSASTSSETDEKEGSGDKKEDEAVPVDVQPLGRGPIEEVLKFSSNIEAEVEVQVFSQARRLVIDLLVEEADIVEKGAPLLQLQDDEQRSSLDKIKSQFDKASREYRRQENLFKQTLISEQVFNDAKYEHEQMEIAVGDAERELGYTKVEAPIRGTVTHRMVNLGDQVQMGQHLFDMVDFDSLVARIFVPEKHLDKLSKGLPVRVHAQSLSEGRFNASVSRIAPTVDPKSGTVKVTVGIGRQEGLRPGMYVDVDLVTSTHENALLIPKRALVYDGDQVCVFRLKDDQTVERVFLDVLLSDRDFIEPVDGFEPGDRIVVAGQTGLKDGALVSLPEGEAKSDDEEKDEDAGSSTSDPVPAKQ